MPVNISTSLYCGVEKSTMSPTLAVIVVLLTVNFTFDDFWLLKFSTWMPLKAIDRSGPSLSLYLPLWFNVSSPFTEFLHELDSSWIVVIESFGMDLITSGDCLEMKPNPNP
jgi:hypothetical protein